MNTVHEPGSRTMSKNLTPEKYRVKPGQKQVACTECTTSWPSSTPSRAGPACLSLPAAQAPRAPACLSRGPRAPVLKCPSVCACLPAAPAPSPLRAQRPCAHAVPRALRSSQPVLKWAVAHFRFLLQIFFP